ncbi:hypothetical protein L0F63_005632, partial [Massospora cicadina]
KGMYQELTSTFNGFFLVFGVLALILNALLIYIALHTNARRREINFAVALAIIDMILPTLAVVDSLLFFISGISAKDNHMTCVFQGPLHFFLPVFSMAAVTVIALERYTVVFNTEPWRRTHALLATACGVFLVVNLVLAATAGYDTGESGIRCNPLPTNVFPIIMSVMLFMMLSILLIATITCYIRILIYAAQVSSEVSDKPSTNLLFNSHQRKRRILLIRIGITSLVYFILISPTCILIPIETLSHPQAREAICITIYFTLFLVSVANPCLILFAHSTFYYRMCILFRSKLQ